MNTHRTADVSTEADVLRLSPEQLVGQLLVVGFDGTELPPALGAELARGGRAGVVLFKRNIADLPSVLQLCREIQMRAPQGLPPLIAIDEEGGRVRRLPAPALALPPMRRLAEHGSPELVQRAARVLGHQLRCLGITMDFAPVVDVDTNPANPVIGDRAFSAEPGAVERYARAFMAGLGEGGVLSCLKHYPGHGDTYEDSHLALPMVPHDAARLQAVELAPFRALAGAADSMMTAHVVYPALDPGVPATLSPVIANTLLRSELGFTGVLFSDDLEMQAIAGGPHTPEAAAVAALEAGCDLLLLCHEATLQTRVQRALEQRIAAGGAFRTRCLEAAARGLRMRRRCPPQPETDGALERLLQEEVEPLMRELAAKGLVA
jgi:beta-N-acetylhexosaminidase